MKIHQLLSGLSMPVSNEEDKFIENHRGSVKVNSLDDRDNWLAQNLVRRGVYELSKDDLTLINKIK